MNTTSKLPKVLYLAMGGTLSAHHPQRTELRHYRTGHYSGEQLIAALPEVESLASITVEQVDNISSTDISYEHWLVLKARIEAASEEGFSGVVVSHGTNTLEETAYFLHLTLGTSIPVVFTGSQRPYSGISSDAQLNLLHAVRVAIEPSCAGLGVLVVMNSKVYSARDVSKTNTYQLEAFQALNTGPLGSIDTDHQVRLHAHPLRLHTTRSSVAQHLAAEAPYVPILYSYAGADGRLLTALLTHQHPEGLVIAGTGAGRCSSLEAAAIMKAKHFSIPIVMSSRLASGRVLPIEANETLGFITADDLPPQKARILLMLCIMAKRAEQDIQQAFETH